MLVSGARRREDSCTNATRRRRRSARTASGSLRIVLRVSRLGEFCMGALQQVVAELHEWRKGLPVARIRAAWGGGWRWHAGPEQGGQRLLGFAGLVEHPGIRMFVDHDVLGNDRRAVGCTYEKPHTHGSRDRSRGRGAGERWQREHRGRALRERRRVAGVLRTFLRPPRGVHGLPAATVHGGRQAA